jgi:hypothetical protein
MTEQTEINTEDKDLALQLDKENTAVAIPNEYAGIGGDDLDDVSVKIGFTKIIQKMSGEVDTGMADVGDFFDTGTQTVIGKEMNVILVKKVTDWAWFPSKEDKAAGVTETKYSSDGVKWNNDAPVTEEQFRRKKRLIMYIVNADCPDMIPSIFAVRGLAWGAGNFITSTIKRFVKVNGESIFSRSFNLSSEKFTNSDNQVNQKLCAKLNEGFNSKEVLDICLEARMMAEAHIKMYSSQNELQKDELGLDS